VNNARVSPEPLPTHTCVSVDGVDTLCPMLAFVLQTVIVILLTLLANITWQTFAPEKENNKNYSDASDDLQKRQLWHYT